MRLVMFLLTLPLAMNCIGDHLALLIALRTRAFDGGPVLQGHPQFAPYLTTSVSELLEMHAALVDTEVGSTAAPIIFGNEQNQYPPGALQAAAGIMQSSWQALNPGPASASLSPRFHFRVDTWAQLPPRPIRSPTLQMDASMKIILEESRIASFRRNCPFRLDTQLPWKLSIESSGYHQEKMKKTLQIHCKVAMEPQHGVPENIGLIGGEVEETILASPGSPACNPAPCTPPPRMKQLSLDNTSADGHPSPYRHYDSPWTKRYKTWVGQQCFAQTHLPRIVADDGDAGLLEMTSNQEIMVVQDSSDDDMIIQHNQQLIPPEEAASSSGDGGPVYVAPPFEA